MRFSCKIFINEKTSIPTDYRRYLLSFIKEAIKNSGHDGSSFYEKFYGNNNTKPFTFSAYFPIDRNNVINGDFFTFFFSSNDYDFIMRVYNGIIAIDRQKNYTLFGGAKLSIKQFSLLPDKIFDSNEATFKTISPFLVRDTEDGDYYLVPKNSLNGRNLKYAKESEIDEIKNSLKLSIFSMAKKYLTEAVESNIQIDLPNLNLAPVVHSSNHSKFKFTLPALKGVIKITANPKILKLIYDIGLGARRSEGFGMLEVVE